MSFQVIRQAKHLLLSGLIASVGLWTVPAQAQVSDARVNAVVEALRQAAPPNRPNDGMYSQWQVLPGIIPSWTKQCVGRELTPAQFESDAAAARNTVSCIVRRELDKQFRATRNNEATSVRNVACWWMTGNAGGCGSGATATYVQRVVGFYQQSARGTTPPAQRPSSSQRSSANTQTPAARPSSSSIALLSDSQVGAMVEALRLAAPRTSSANDGLYSEWQIKPEIIPNWSKQCIGQELTPQQFESDPTAARAIVSCIMQRELNSQYRAANQDETAAVRRTACWWMSGKPTGCDSGAIATYVEKVVGFYQQQARSSSSQPQSSVTSPSRLSPASSSSNVEVSDTQVAAMVESLRQAAPRSTNLYSAWGVTAGIIPSWTKQCVGRELTPAEFNADATAARNTVSCIMRRELTRQLRETGNDELLAVQRVASWWLTGDASQYSSTRAASYSQRILRLYQQQIANR